MLFSFFKDNTEIKLIRVIMDNNAVVAYINNTRGIKSDLCDLFSRMAMGCRTTNMYFRSTHPWI